MTIGLKARLRLELFFALIAVALLLAFIFSPDWIETLFGAAPDDGDGGAEWGLAAIAVAVFVAMAWLARRDWRALSSRQPVPAKKPG